MNNSVNFEAARQARRISEQAAAWYIELHDEPDERQQGAFLAWLRASPAHVAEYLAIARMHGDLKAAASLERLSADDLVERVGRANPVVLFPRRENQAAGQHVEVLPRTRRHLRAFASVAAIAVVTLGLLGGMHWRQHRLDTRENFAAGSAAMRSLKLPDGTLVQLDRDSAIEVRFDANYRRIEVVRGNALFDVGHDPARPLLVSVGGHVLQDIGTVFDVKRDASGDTLTVISGRVRVWNALHAWSDESKAVMDELKSGDTVADLVAGEQIQLNPVRVGAVHAVEVAKATAWLPTDIHFQRETVGEVARRFNAYTTTPLAIEDARIADMRISGVFHANNPQAFIAYLSTLPGVRVMRESDRVRIVASSSLGNDHPETL